MKCSVRCTNESWEDWFSSEEERAIVVFNIMAFEKRIRVGELILPLIKRKFEYEINVTLEKSELLNTVGVNILFKPIKDFKLRIEEPEINHEFDIYVAANDTVTINGDILLNERH